MLSLCRVSVVSAVFAISAYYDRSTAYDVRVYLREVLPQIDLADDPYELGAFILVVEELRDRWIVLLVSADHERVEVVLRESGRSQLVVICLQELDPRARLDDFPDVLLFAVAVDGLQHSRADVLDAYEVLEDLVEDGGVIFQGSLGVSNLFVQLLLDRAFPSEDCFSDLLEGQRQSLQLLLLVNLDFRHLLLGGPEHRRILVRALADVLLRSLDRLSDLDGSPIVA